MGVSVATAALASKFGLVREVTDGGRVWWRRPDEPFARARRVGQAGGCDVWGSRLTVGDTGMTDFRSEEFHLRRAVLFLVDTTPE